MNRVTIDLQAREVVTIDAPGTRVACMQGRVWLTQDRDVSDVILESGDSFEITRPGPTVLQALRTARVSFVAVLQGVLREASVPAC